MMSSAVAAVYLRAAQRVNALGRRPSWFRPFARRRWLRLSRAIVDQAALDLVEVFSAAALSDAQDTTDSLHRRWEIVAAQGKGEVN